VVAWNFYYAKRRWREREVAARGDRPDRESPPPTPTSGRKPSPQRLYYRASLFSGNRSIKGRLRCQGGHSHIGDLEANPGGKAGEAASRVRINPNHAQTILGNLIEQDAATKEGQQYTVAAGKAEFTDSRCDLCADAGRRRPFRPDRAVRRTTSFDACATPIATLLKRLDFDVQTMLGFAAQTN
jgi:hypothetical protein